MRYHQLNMPVSHADIIAAARKYLDTPFQDKGRRKGQGLDCVGLVLAVCDDLGILDKNGEPITRFLYMDYPSQPVGNYVHQRVHQHMIAKAVRAMQPGDVVTMAVPASPCHVGIVGENVNGLTLIHAYGGGPKKCIEHLIDFKWQRRIVGCFSIPGVE